MITTRPITLNADLGEHDGGDARAAAEAARLIELIDVANVACGGHAGDAATMRATIEACRARGVVVGAHPSYPDRAGFGRASMAIELQVLREELASQIAQLEAAARQVGVPAQEKALAHVKPHGALYHDVARDPALASMFAEVVVAAGVGAVVLPAAARTAHVFRAHDLRVVAEGFADRRYASDGVTLLPRSDPRALLHDPAEAAAQASALCARGTIDTLCIHGDSENALAIARAVRAALS